MKISIVLRAWLFFGGLAASLLAAVMAFRGELRWAMVCVLFALGADAAGRLWSRNAPAPMPYFMRWVLLVPRGPHSPERLKEILQPRSGERILEIGPGIGVHALPIAGALLPDGVLHVLEVQRKMLDELALRAAKFNIGNIAPMQGDARQLPYPDGIFDGAYMIGVLGEIPDAAAALSELRRVLKPSGRLVVGELLIDPDFVPFPALRENARNAGFTFQRRVGPNWAYSAMFRPATPDA